MNTPFIRSGCMLGLAGAALATLSCTAPVLLPGLASHGLADQRMLWGLTGGVNALACLPMALAGAAGLALLVRAGARIGSAAQRTLGVLCLGGLVVLALASAAYDLDPGDARQQLERAAVMLVLSGLLGLCAAGQIGERAGFSLGLAALGLGSAALEHAVLAGDPLPWRLFEAACLAAPAWMAGLPTRRSALAVNGLGVAAAGIACALFALGDATVYLATAGWVSGRSLAHLASAALVLPLIAALLRPGRRVQNATATAAAPLSAAQA